jgi:hypothetical protein
MTLALESESPTPASSDAGESTGTRAWLRNRIARGTLSPGRALVLSGRLVAEAIDLAEAGFHVTVVDRSKEALGAAHRASGGHGAGALKTIRGDYFRFRPGMFGSVDCILDRDFFQDLPAGLRADWAHAAGRLLRKDGRLLAVFRTGRGAEGPPYAITEEAIRKLLGRLFVVEDLSGDPPSAPGAPGVLRGDFRKT